MQTAQFNILSYCQSMINFFAINVNKTCFRVWCVYSLSLSLNFRRNCSHFYCVQICTAKTYWWLFRVKLQSFLQSHDMIAVFYSQSQNMAIALNTLKKPQKTIVHRILLKIEMDTRYTYNHLPLNVNSDAAKMYSCRKFERSKWMILGNISYGKVISFLKC